MPTPRLVLSVSGLSFAWPDGSPVLTSLSLDVPSGRSGLVGANGSGKTTLLRLLAGELVPTHGSVSVTGAVGYLPQDLTLRVEERVEDHLGVGAVRRALTALEHGRDPEHQLEVIGERWDLEERTLALLDRLGLPSGVLDRRLGELSGGEVRRLALGRLLLDRPAVLLLDEPTNDLDAPSRDRLLDVLDDWRGTVLLVSHDPAALERVERIADLHEGRVRWYGGGWTAYAEALAAEQEAAESAVRSAESDVRSEQRDLRRSEQVLAGRRRYGQKMWDTKREPKIVMGARKRAAQVSAGKYTATHEDRLADARGRLNEAEARLRSVAEIRVDLPGTRVPPTRVVLETHDLVLRTGRAVDLAVDGAERIAVTGPNGSGKTTLLHTLAGTLSPQAGTVDVRVPLRLLPQRMDLLDGSLSVADNVAAAAPGATTNEVRALLARFRFRGATADRLVADLSGGELFRATLASLLLARPAPQLLLLDEPTNNLDLASRRQLVTALEGYAGALVVASHDEAFLAEIGITRELGSGP